MDLRGDRKCAQLSIGWLEKISVWGMKESGSKPGERRQEVQGSRIRSMAGVFWMEQSEWG